MAERRFTIRDTPLAGLKVVERTRVGDERGFIQRLYCRDEFADTVLSGPIVQINHALTHRRGAVRGMHFQRPPFGEDKLVTVLRGEVWDVAVDLRAGSPTFLRWHGERLSADNGRSLLLPRGFAHGFQALVDDCELFYLHSCHYEPGSEGAVNALDPALAINWPLSITEMSTRDRAHPLVDASFTGITP